MCRIFGVSALLAALLLGLPSGGEGQDKKDAKKKSDVVVEETTTADYAALAKTKEIWGKISALDLKAGTMTLTIEWQHWEPKDAKGADLNQAMAKYQQQIMREYNQIMTSKNPITRQQGLVRLQQTMAGANFQKMFKVVKSCKDFDLEVMTDLKVARANLEVKYDDNGEIVKYSDADLKKMKSTDMPGGYKASPDDLTVGQGVKLSLSPPKKKATDDTDDKSSSAGKTPLTQVRMVLIVTEYDPPETKAKDDKKKKKN